MTDLAADELDFRIAGARHYESDVRVITRWLDATDELEEMLSYRSAHKELDALLAPIGLLKAFRNDLADHARTLRAAAGESWE